MLRLQNHLLPLLRAAAASPHPRPCFRLSTSTSTSPLPFSLEDYLVAACGLAPAQAREVSKKAFRGLSREHSKEEMEMSRSRLMSAFNPDAIIAMLAGAGLSRADIAAAVTADPLLLRASVKNVAPRLLALRERVGLSAPQIASLVVVDARALRGCDVVPKLQFFIPFFGGSFEKVLVAARWNGSLLSSSLARQILPNIALFRRWGVRDIAQLCLTVPRVLTYNPERMKEFLPRAERLGVPPSSGLFGHAVAAVASMSQEKIAAKLEFFKRTLGCSESEVSTAVSKMPSILVLSDEVLRCKIEFLVNETAMEPQKIVERPILLGMSLKNRLVPRQYVVKILREKGLLNSNMSFSSIASISEKAFKSKFIDCHKDSVPGLADAYAAARAGVVPSRV